MTEHPAPLYCSRCHGTQVHVVPGHVCARWRAASSAADRRDRRRTRRVLVLVECDGCGHDWWTQHPAAVSRRHGVSA